MISLKTFIKAQELVVKLIYIKAQVTIFINKRLKSRLNIKSNLFIKIYVKDIRVS